MKHASKVMALLLALSTWSVGQTPQESKAADNKATETKATETKATETKAPDNKASTEKPYDQSDWLTLLAAAEGGGGLDSTRFHQPTAFAGVKLGSVVNVDLGYDRIRGQNGFSTEVSAMLPVFRFPGPQADGSKNYLRVYAEPGLGYRAGSGPFGGYTSAKIMVALFSDDRISSDKFKVSPFLEFQHRFPFNSPLRGDSRVSFGLMIAVCAHCGLQ